MNYVRTEGQFFDRYQFDYNHFHTRAINSHMESVLTGMHIGPCMYMLHTQKVVVKQGKMYEELDISILLLSLVNFTTPAIFK